MLIPMHISEQLYKEIRDAIARWIGENEGLLMIHADSVFVGSNTTMALEYFWSHCKDAPPSNPTEILYVHWRYLAQLFSLLNVRSHFGPDEMRFPRLCAMYATAHAWVNAAFPWDPNKYHLYDGSKPLNLYIMREVQDNGQTAIVAAKDAAEARSLTHIDLDGDEWFAELMGVSDEFYEPRVVFSQVKE